MLLNKSKNVVDLSESFKLLNKIRDIENGVISSKEFSSAFKIHLQRNDKGIKFNLLHFQR